LKSTWDEQVGIAQFEQLCQRFQESYPSFMAELRKKRDYYLAFLKYPDAIRRSLSTTNTLEAINGQLKIIRRNSGYLLPGSPPYPRCEIGGRSWASAVRPIRATMPGTASTSASEV
jgi:Transposase, Mutator family